MGSIACPKLLIIFLTVLFAISLVFSSLVIYKSAELAKEEQYNAAKLSFKIIPESENPAEATGREEAPLEIIGPTEE